MNNFLKLDFVFTKAVCAMFVFIGLVVSLFFFSKASAVSVTTLFSDGFESGNFSAWTSVDDPKWDVSNNNAHSGTKKAEVEGNTGSNDDILQKTVSTSGYQTITFSFWYKAGNLENSDDDYVKAEWTADGSTWTTVSSITDDDETDSWTQESFALPATANNNPNFTLRFRAHLNHGNDDVKIDDVQLTGEQLPQSGTIIVRKITNPSDAQDSFSFSVGNNQFNLTNGNEYSIDVSEGTYTIAETILEGWVLSNISCEYDGESVGEAAPPNGETVTISAGDTVVCTFTNTKLGKIIIKKVTEPEQDEDGQSFDFETSYADEITLNSENEYTHESEWLMPDEYSVSEQVPEGWDLTSVVCSDDSDPEEIELDYGEIVTCVFTNTERGSTIVGYKWEDMNGNGVWDENEPAREGWHIALGRALPDANPEDNIIPIEIIALSLTGADGKYVLPVRESGNYKVFEEKRDGWHATNPPAIDSFFDIEYSIDLATNSFFDVFVDFPSGQTVTYDTNERQLNFGNWHDPVVTGYKWDDIDGNGEWNRETEHGIAGWNMALGRVGESRQGEDGKTHIPIEIVQLSLTGLDGGYNLPVSAPGNYMVLEESRNGWQATSPAPQHIDSFFDIEYRIDLINPPQWSIDSFFDVFIEVSGQQFEQGFVFGNHESNRQETGGGDENTGGGDNQTPTDMCPNIDGVQVSVPDGMELVDGNCVPITTTASSPNQNNGNDNNGMLFTPGNSGGGQVLGAFTSVEEQIAQIRSQINALQQRLVLVLREELRRLIQALINALQAQIDALN